MSVEMTRRQFAGVAVAGVLAGCGKPVNSLQIAMLHVEPRLGELDRNSDLYEPPRSRTAPAIAGSNAVAKRTVRYSYAIAPGWSAISIFAPAESVVVANGECLVPHTSEHSSVLVVEWDFVASRLIDRAVFA
jgi:hypothetical protein